MDEAQISLHKAHSSWQKLFMANAKLFAVIGCNEGGVSDQFK
jgi:hypothetical protein